VEKSSAPHAEYIYSALNTSFTTPKYSAAVGDALTTFFIDRITITLWARHVVVHSFSKNYFSAHFYRKKYKNICFHHKNVLNIKITSFLAPFYSGGTLAYEK
jgi:hypothetical protein